MNLYRIIDSSEQAIIRPTDRLIHQQEETCEIQEPLDLLRCWKRRIIQNGLRVWLLVESEKGKRIAERTRHSLLRERIGEVRKAKVRIKWKWSRRDPSQMNSGLNWMMYVHELKKRCITKLRQKNKFDRLNANSFTPPSYTKSENRVVINLSRKSLNNTEEEVLSLGMNFAIAPWKIPVAEISYCPPPKHEFCRTTKSRSQPSPHHCKTSRTQPLSPTKRCTHDSEERW